MQQELTRKQRKDEIVEKKRITAEKKAVKLEKKRKADEEVDANNKRNKFKVWLKFWVIKFLYQYIAYIDSIHIIIISIRCIFMILYICDNKHQIWDTYFAFFSNCFHSNTSFKPI